VVRASALRAAFEGLEINFNWPRVSAGSGPETKRNREIMGEIDDLEGMFPEVEDEPECGASHLRDTINSVGCERVSGDSFGDPPLENGELVSPAALRHSGSPGLLGAEQDGEMMGILTHNNSSFGLNPHDKSPTSVRHVHPFAPAWQDFPLANDLLKHDDTFHCQAARGEGSKTSRDKKNAVNKENAVERRGSRKRTNISRYDPVEADGKASTRSVRVKQDKDQEEEQTSKKRPARVKLEIKEEEADASHGRVARARASRRAGPGPPASSSVNSQGSSSRQGRAASSQQAMQRGKHVRHKPQMQKTARAGQRRWKNLLERLRDEAEGATGKVFAKQMNEVGACFRCVRQRREYTRSGMFDGKMWSVRT